MLQFIFGMLVGIILGFAIFALVSISISEKQQKTIDRSRQNKGDSDAHK